MTTNKPASEMPDEVTVSRIRWEDGYILTLMDYGDCPDPVRQTVRYVRADKPDAAAAREVDFKSLLIDEFYFTVSTNNYALNAKIEEVLLDAAEFLRKRILQREAGV